MAELAEIIEQCRIEIYRDGLQDEALQEALFLARLAAWAAVPVWVESWHVGERRCCDVFLSEAEMHCAARRYRPPQRVGRDHVLRQAEAPTGRALSRRDITILEALLHQPGGGVPLPGGWISAALRLIPLVTWRCLT